MNNIRKAAYRNIIYQFLLDVRTEPVPLMDDKRAIIKGRYAGPVAYQLHNLALASVNDFVDFDERHFWASIDSFNQRNPETNIIHLRVAFEALLRSG
ncbi:hypothetical protein [Hymenobacter guriensis]|uniref:Uncharacterized protein n=1 Tax=Hymenobacter guriensis TaxID=2793065 RepID=A0ABS0KYD3_9BACT|nr:hypothetical protein [Hymenobacter guriensis]MBG8552864.1 hypothetical protein [Hymenobacter guriensis]